LLEGTFSALKYRASLLAVDANAVALGTHYTCNGDIDTLLHDAIDASLTLPPLQLLRNA